MSALRLKGRIALLTGSTNGIGFSIAERLGLEGAKLIISSRNKENVDTAVKKLSDKGYDVNGVACHIGDNDQRKNLIKEAEKQGGLDILVQCAGVNPKAAVCSILDCPEDAWDKIFNINLKSNFLLTKDTLHLLKKSKCPRVIYNSSIVAYTPNDQMAAYSISKTALVALTRLTAMHLGKYGITVNCLAPGLIDTKFGQAFMNDKLALAQIKGFNGVKRPGKPEEVSGIAAFLATDEASYITGETICITGGYPCRI